MAISDKLFDRLCKAKEMARKSDMNDRHGAIMWSKKGYCGLGHNHNNMDKFRFGKIYGRRLCSVHAEISCLIDCRLNVMREKRMKMLVIKLKRDESLGLSKPCGMCMAYLRKFKIKKVYYSTDDGIIESIKVNCIDRYNLSHGVIIFLKNGGVPDGIIRCYIEKKILE